LPNCQQPAIQAKSGAFDRSLKVELPDDKISMQVEKNGVACIVDGNKKGLIGGDNKQGVVMRALKRKSGCAILVKISFFDRV